MAFSHSGSTPEFSANIRQKVTVADDNDPLDPNYGFMVDADGELVFRARGEAALGDAMPVLAGIIYPIDVAEVDFATSTTTAAAWLLRRATL